MASTQSKNGDPTFMASLRNWMRIRPTRLSSKLILVAAVFIPLLSSCDSPSPPPNNSEPTRFGPDNTPYLTPTELHSLCLDGGSAGIAAYKKANATTLGFHAVVLECDSIWSNSETFKTYVNTSGSAIANLDASECTFDFTLTSPKTQLNYRFATTNTDTISKSICKDYIRDVLYDSTANKGGGLSAFVYANKITVTIDIRERSANSLSSAATSSFNSDTTQYIYLDGATASIARWYNEHNSLAEISNYKAKHFGNKHLVSFPVKFTDSLTEVPSTTFGYPGGYNCPEIRTLRWIKCDNQSGICADEDGNELTSAMLSYAEVTGGSRTQSVLTNPVS